MQHRILRTLAVLLTLFMTTAAFAVDTDDTRMLIAPTPSSTHLVFLYAGDVWVSNIDGSAPRRLSTHPGTEDTPAISPDGKLVAFTANYDGNPEAYVVPIDGGIPRRLTWHPGADYVWGFTPDSKAVLFGSNRHDFSGRYLQLFTVPVDGDSPTKQPTQLPVPRGFHASFSPDGQRIAYNPDRQVFRQWKNYRGGTTSRIWIQNLKDPAFEKDSVEEVPQAEGRSNDTDPMWIGGKLYFRSDRNGEFNLFSYDFASKAIEQHTFHEDFPIINASAGGAKIAYEQAGYAHLFDPSTGESERLKIGIATDLLERRPRWESDARSYVRNADISYSGARAVFEYRGEIVTVPAEKGDPRNITNTVAVHERSPLWSPDGKKIAYFSDLDGEYKLHLRVQDGTEPAKVYDVEGHGFYDTPRFSPDGKKISYIDNSQSIYVLDLESGASEKVMSEIIYGPIRTTHHAWSPDSKWLAYTRVTRTYFQVLALYSIDDKKSYEISEGLADVGEPVFDASGKYLYFYASTDAGPNRQWFAQSNADDAMSRSLYLAVLKADEPSPLAPESDEEKGKEEKEDNGKEEEKENGKEEEKPADGKKAKEGKKAKKGKHDEPAETEVAENAEDKMEEPSIDVEGLDQRILALPLEPAIYANLAAGDGKLFFIEERPRSQPGYGVGPGGGDFKVFELEKREATQLLAGVRSFVLSGDQKKVLVSTNGGFQIGNAGAPIKPGDGRLAVDKIRVRVDPVAEWQQIYDEAWRINRDYFYDPNMHGADWPAMREKYAPFLPHLTQRDDLARLLRWMISELAVGHSRNGGGDSRFEGEFMGSGLLGADFEIADGKYRFARIYRGGDWNPSLRAPLTEPGVDARAGEYLLAVNGRPLDASENVYSFFENTVDEVVDISLGPNADGSGSRTVQVRPVGGERMLRFFDWVEGNIRKVDEATDGRVAYVYVPNTAGAGHSFFKRYFYPQGYKDAIIVDERFNGGGAVADYYIDILRRPAMSYWTMRYGGELKSPIASIQGPMAMLINESAGSGGDLLPWMFRQYEMGPLIGKRTWGGLVGTLGFPRLMDGGWVTAPNLGFWTPEEGFGVENVGVPPDLDVEQSPAEVNAGGDPQLEKAIEWILKELAENPPQKPEKPAFPIRVRR